MLTFQVKGHRPTRHNAQTAAWLADDTATVTAGPFPGRHGQRHEPRLPLLAAGMWDS